MEVVGDTDEDQQDTEEGFDRLFRKDHQDEPGIGDQVEDWGPGVSWGTKRPGHIGLFASQDDQGGDCKGVEEASCKDDAVGQEIEDRAFSEIVRRLDQGG